MGQTQVHNSRFDEQTEAKAVASYLVLSAIDPALPLDLVRDIIQLLIKATCCSDIVDIAAGYYHSLALTATGSIWSWGRNEEGQLGIGHTENVSTPRTLSLHNVISIACGHYHSMALTSDGVLYAWGENRYFQLGVGDNEPRTTPTRVIMDEFGDEEVTSMSCGDSHSIALTKAGHLYVWGINLSGQLGLGTNSSSSKPVRLTAIPEKFKLIACGKSHSLAVTEYNQMYGWGSNFNNQVGVGLVSLPVQLTPQKLTLPEKGKITSIAAGNEHSLAIIDNVLCGWGNNANGQLTNRVSYVTGDVTSPAKIQGFGVPYALTVSCGGAFSLLQQNNSLLVWGRNVYGQLGTPLAKVAYPTHNGIKDAKKAVCGGRHTLLIRSDGRVYGFGSNCHGQLGQPLSTKMATSPVLVPFSLIHENAPSSNPTNP